MPPDLEYEQNWMQLTQLAYIQLWAARDLVKALPRAWEKYYHKKLIILSHSGKVQRNFYRIIRTIGTPAVSPKPCGFSVERLQGGSKQKRKRHPVVTRRKFIYQNRLVKK